MREESTTSSARETQDLARRFAGRLRRGEIVTLRGELGTGKTVFVKGVCEAFGAHGRVSSPSFVILNRYDGKDATGKELLIYHLDLYRVRSLDEIYDLGYEEFFYGDGITLIEWAEQLGELLPMERYDVHLDYGTTGSQRLITIEHKEHAGTLSRKAGSEK
jgi:tRNA threonylcarbamoyladenosine biosynthesis protein TsaE